MGVWWSATGVAETMDSDSGPLVSVVVPAFNAEATIGETLRSARSQTYGNLEIIVVDDGSTDSTCALVRLQAEEDGRVRLIRQQNAGVAAARNAGAAAASGDFLAPLDADDIWYPDKIARQVAQFADGGDELGLVYTWSLRIDAHSAPIGEHRPTFAGWVMPRLATSNFVGNGSSPLIRMSAFRETQGYDPSLKARGGQGCEDIKLYLQIAERHRFAVVPEFLTGYRVLPGNMSSDVKQMLRSQDTVAADFTSSHPELASTFHESRNRLSRYMLKRAITEGDWAAAATLIGPMVRHDPRFTARTLSNIARDKFKALIGR